MALIEHFEKGGEKGGRARAVPLSPSPPGFWAAKRGFDIALGLALLPLLALVALALLLLNPAFNRGPLFYTHARMGQGLVPFTMVKFRSMTAAAEIARGANDPVEAHRITRLGGLLRTLRLDELPQVLNVLRGEMSLIGPRPDYAPHALAHAQTLRGYEQRYRVRPGISGLAQVRQGYTHDKTGARGKLRYDLRYIRHAGFRMETYILLRTLRTVLTGFGAR